MSPLQSDHGAHAIQILICGPVIEFFEQAQLAAVCPSGGPGGSNLIEAESFFSRLRRAEVGHYHHIAGLYLTRYAQESAFREGQCRDDNGTQAHGVVRLALKTKPSVDFAAVGSPECTATIMAASYECTY